MAGGEPSRQRSGGVKLDRALFAVLVALWVVTLGILMIPEPAGALGAAHSDFAGMRDGGVGLERHAPVLWAGWAFGGVGIVFYVALMAFGTRKGAHRRAVRRWLVVGLLAFLGAWTWLVVAYRGYMVDGPGRLFLGFPLPTAVMLYVLFPASLILTATYVVGFGRWVLSEDDEAAYQRLLEETQDRRSPASTPAPGEAGEGTG